MPIYEYCFWTFIFLADSLLVLCQNVQNAVFQKLIVTDRELFRKLHFTKLYISKQIT